MLAMKHGHGRGAGREEKIGDEDDKGGKGGVGAEGKE